MTADELRGQVRGFLAGHDPASMDRLEFLRARFDAGLAWVHYPAGLGGQGLSRDLQAAVDAEFAAVGAPNNRPERNGIGLGMAAPTILAFGSPEQQRRWLRPLWTGEEIWCQGYSEPDAGSDLTSLRTTAELDSGHWRLNGQKIWTSGAQFADWCFCLVRTDNSKKHEGISFLLIDMKSPGVEVRPIKLISGNSPFCETFFDNVRVPKSHVVGTVNRGWDVAKYLLQHERAMISGMGERGVGRPLVEVAPVDAVPPVRHRRDAANHVAGPLEPARRAQTRLDGVAQLCVERRQRDQRDHDDAGHHLQPQLSPPESSEQRSEVSRSHRRSPSPRDGAAAGCSRRRAGCGSGPARSWPACAAGM